MSQSSPGSIKYVAKVAFIVAIGGFLMGFDASVISGVVRFIEVEFNLSKIELGWAVASLSLTATLAMFTAGPLSDKFGRRAILKLAAILFSISAIGSALAPDFIWLVVMRMLGGLGVGAALIIAPMYIAEIAPPKHRGRLVSLNQLNIVVGISVAFFSNYLILNMAGSEQLWVQSLLLDTHTWRWMLGVEAVPAVLYLLFLLKVPESPRWLIMHNRREEAIEVVSNYTEQQQARVEVEAVENSMKLQQTAVQPSFGALLSPKLRLVMVIGISIAVLQQITGINAIFFYAPMIFEQSGFGTDAAFMQAVFVGLTNLVFTLVAISLIDKLGRKQLLIAGVTGIALCMFVLSLQFYQATYTLTETALAALPENIDRNQLSLLVNQTFTSDLDFLHAIQSALGAEQAKAVETSLLSASITLNQTLVLAAILGFVACFAVSLGPVMWVLFSELFPNQIRATAISFVGLINSAVSFGIQLLFPWELANLGSALTFALFGVFAVVGLAIMLRLLPETKGKSLEELEIMLVQK